jgi:hypothetical protein
MCHPRNDHLIVRLIAEGRLVVDTQGMGALWTRDGRTGRVRRATERVEQAGKRPAAAEYRKIIVRIDGHVRSLRVNRIVYVAAFGPTELEIDHLDDDPLNCGIANLCALTRTENQHKAMWAKWLRDNGLGPEDDECDDDDEDAGDYAPF